MIGNSKSNHLGAQGTFNPRRNTRFVFLWLSGCQQNHQSLPLFSAAFSQGMAAPQQNVNTYSARELG